MKSQFPIISYSVGKHGVYSIMSLSGVFVPQPDPGAGGISNVETHNITIYKLS